MSDWQPVETAPRDDRVIEVRRLIDGNLHFEGFARFGFPTNRKLPGINTCARHWVEPGGRYLVPTPTHWRPER